MFVSRVDEVLVTKMLHTKVIHTETYANLKSKPVNKQSTNEINERLFIQSNLS